MRTILVPTDFSETANNARDYAINLAQKLNAQIILLNTYHIAYSGANAGTIVNLEQLAVKEAQIAMKNESDFLSLNFPKLEFKTVCKPGLLLDVVKKIGKKKEVDLIVMGTNGAFGFINDVIGSNNSALVGEINIPIISVPQHSRVLYPEKIVIANDLLESGEENLLFYLNKIASEKKSLVDFIFVVKEDDDVENKVERLKSKSNELLFRSEFHIIDSEENKNIEDVVFEHVNSQKSDLLILVAHQRGFWENIFHKSISKNMVKHATLPIMVLPD